MERREETFSLYRRFERQQGGGGTPESFQRSCPRVELRGKGLEVVDWRIRER